MIFTKEIKDTHATVLAESLGYDPQKETPEQRIQRFIDEQFDVKYAEAIKNFVQADPAVVAAREALATIEAAKLAEEKGAKAGEAQAAELK